MPSSGFADCLTNILEKSIALRPRFFLLGGATKPSLEPFVSKSGGLFAALGLPEGVILPVDPLSVEIDNAREACPEIVVR